ncbi:MAG: hypothetical protein LBQ28_05075 [Prevotellaceae bacterium]|nr:hypothetical protein [Prevotellaceae bacterium]
MHTEHSREDIVLTKVIQKGCEAVRIQLLGHLIVTEERYMSFADEGLI